MRFLMAILLIGGTFMVATTWDSSESRHLRTRIGKLIRGNDSDKIERAKQSVTEYFSRPEQPPQAAAPRSTPTSNGIPRSSVQSPAGLQSPTASRRIFPQLQENPRRRVFLRRPLLRNAQDPQ